jgi:hypothetical protein
MEPSRAFLVRSIAAACAAAALGAVSSSPLAATGGGTLSNGTLSGSYSYLTGDGTLSISLTNNIMNPADLSQLLSDVSFSLTSGSLGSGSITGTGNLVDCIDGQLNCTQSSKPASPWVYGTNTAGVGSGAFLLTALQGIGNNTGGSLIIGTTSDGYCQHQGGSTGFKCPDGIGNTNFQPYFQPTATFTFSGLTNVTSATQLTNVALSFGTSAETVVPIPAAVWLFGSGLVGLIGIARRKITGGSSPAPALA